MARLAPAERTLTGGDRRRPMLPGPVHGPGPPATSARCIPCARNRSEERSTMEAPTRPIPQPITPEAKPYWEGLKAGKLMLPKCEACGKPFFYPRILCPFCHADRITWMQASGRGKLHAFEIAYQSFNPAYKIKPPYILALIELEEGPRMYSNLINIEPDPKAVKCDMPVEVVFEKLTEEITIPLFQPAK
jgi:uncharacterized OB-fold protein